MANKMDAWRDENQSGFLAEKLLEVVLRERFKIPEVASEEVLPQESVETKGKKYTGVVFARMTVEQDMNGLGDFAFYVPNKGWVKIDLGTNLSSEAIEEKKKKDEKNGLEPLFIGYEQIERASRGSERDLEAIYENIKNLLTG